MTATSGTDRSRAEGEATVWLVRLAEGQDDTELRASFEAWRAANPLNAESWDRARLAYDLIGKRKPRHREHWEPYAERRSRERSLPPAGRSAPAGRQLLTRRRVGAGLALAACIVFLAATFLPGLLLQLQADVVTRTAELRRLTLEDGSRVSLGPESAIDVAFDDGKRQVRLLKGAGFFEVSPDEAHPFRVEAGDALITVLGTAFEVRRGADGTFIAVQHGRVRVEDMRTMPREADTLQAGEWARVPRSGSILRGTLKEDEVASWRNRKLVVLNRPAGEIIDELRPYYPGAVVVQSGVFAKRQVSGIYDLNDPRATLRDLASSHGGQVHELSDWLMVITTRGDAKGPE